MFGPLGVPELLFIFLLALLIFGPRKLPEIGRTLGKGIAEFRKASNELKRTINAEVIRDEIRQNDPRRVLREAMEEPWKPDPPKPSSTGDEPPPAAADEKPEDGPGGTVARSSGGEAVAEKSGEPSEPTSETAAEAISSPSP